MGLTKNCSVHLLGNCWDNPVHSTFSLVIKRVYIIVLGIPREAKPDLPISPPLDFEIEGEATFSGQKSPLQHYPFRFDNDTIIRCNWLEKHSMNGYIIAGHDPREWHATRKTDTYDITISFSKPPPVEASLWLHWTE